MESRSPAYVAVLAVIAGSILMVGSLMKPAELEPEPAALPTQAESARLQRIAQRRSLEDMAEVLCGNGFECRRASGPSGTRRTNRDCVGRRGNGHYVEYGRPFAVCIAGSRDAGNDLPSGRAAGAA